MKRVAYVGLSSPCGYWYDSNSEFSNGKNVLPILESPQALCVLYDEVWFLTEDLCPLTLKQLPYVKFIIEDSNNFILVLKAEEAIEANYMAMVEDFKLGHIDPKNLGLTLKQFISEVTSEPESHFVDNHSTGIKLGLNFWTGNCWSPKQVLFDILLTEYLSQHYKYNIELVVNSYTNLCMPWNPHFVAENAAEKVLQINRLTSINKPNGPVMNNVDRLRENKYVHDFRTFITSLPQMPVNGSNDDIAALVQIAFEEYHRKVINDAHAELKGAKIASSSLLATYDILGGAGSALISGSQEILRLVGLNKTSSYNWAAFLNDSATQARLATHKASCSANVMDQIGKLSRI